MSGYPRLQLTLPLHVCALCPLQGRGRDMDSAESELVAYDADHERRRKSQLERLYNRTPEQVPYKQTDRQMGLVGPIVYACVCQTLAHLIVGCGVNLCLQRRV